MSSTADAAVAEEDKKNLVLPQTNSFPSSSTILLSSPRSIATTIKSRETTEGDGVTVLRSLGFDESMRCDPFLLLDHIDLEDKGKGKKSRGFPDHPHRGFCTLTIVFDGQVEHRDSVGNHGLVQGPLGLQWMCAGRGVIHSEMPTPSAETKRMHGLQLWTNLKSTEKMTKPRYQDVSEEQVPLVKVESGGCVRVLAGSYNGANGPLKRHPGVLLVVQLSGSSSESFQVAEDWNSFVYVIKGSGSIEKQSIEAKNAYVLKNDGDGVVVSAGKKGIEFLFATAAPLNEPIVQHGPFIMTSRAEIDQALQDMKLGKLARQIGGKK